MAEATCTVRVRYRPRRPTECALHRLVQTHYDELAGVYDERFAAEYGFWRPEIERTVHAFLDCGVPELGLARLRCGECRRELYVPFSCKTRCLCTSCHAKRAVLWAEWLAEHVLAPVRHAQWTFTIPKRLRRTFLFDRRLLGELSRCAWLTVRAAYREATGERDVVPGMVAAIQTFGAQAANWHPHVHALVTAGVFSRDGGFTFVPSPDPRRAETSFQRRVLSLLVRKQRLEPEAAAGMKRWPHSGFSVHLATVASAADRDGLERLARYLQHPPISAERLDYRGADQPCRYRASRPDPRTGSQMYELDPLDMLARLVQHIPPPRMHLTRHYGAYSNRRRAQMGGRRTQPAPRRDDEPRTEAERHHRRHWARLIAKVFAVPNPLECPCGGRFRVIALIHNPAALRRLLQHLDKLRARSPPAP